MPRQPEPQQDPEAVVASEASKAAVGQPVSPLWRWAKILSVVACVVLYLLGFILQVAGVSSISDDCKDLEDGFGSSRSSSGILTTGVELDSNCDGIARPFWWATFFHSIVILAIGIAAMLKITKDIRLALLTLFGIAILQIMDRTEEALDIGNSELFEDGGRIAAAGYVISAMVDFLLLFAVAVEKMPHPQMPCLS